MRKPTETLRTPIFEFRRLYHTIIIVTQKPAMRLTIPTSAYDALLTKTGVFVGLFVVLEEAIEAFEDG